MWIRRTYTKANGYWLASPSSYDTHDVGSVTYIGYVDYDIADSDSYGFRPLVSIPKSAVQ